MMNRRMALLLGVAVLAGGCGKQSDETTAKAQPATRAISITTAAAATADVPVILEAVGEVQSIAAPLVSAELPGRVTELRVDVGDRVQKGEVLARLDSSARVLERDAAQADERRVQALIANQEALVRRYHELAKSSFVAQSSIDDAEAQLQALRADSAAAAARVAQAEDHIRRSVITAPLAGRVDQRLVAVGDYVKEGGALFKLSGSGAVLRLMMVFPEPAITQLRVGTPLKVLTAAGMTHRFDAVITELRPAIDTASKGVVAYADLKQPGNNLAGASADVQAIVAVHKGAVVVPSLSLVRRPAGEVVYIIGSDNRAVQRRVVSGVRLDDRIEIVTGLSSGERIAVNGAGFLADGVAVEVKQKSP